MLRKQACRRESGVFVHTLRCTKHQIARAVDTLCKPSLGYSNQSIPPTLCLVHLLAAREAGQHRRYSCVRPGPLAALPHGLQNDHSRGRLLLLAEAAEEAAGIEVKQKGHMTGAKG